MDPEGTLFSGVHDSSTLPSQKPRGGDQPEAMHTLLHGYHGYIGLICGLFLFPARASILRALLPLARGNSAANNFGSFCANHSRATTTNGMDTKLSTQIADTLPYTVVEG